jgi:hypothetical protein
MLRTGASCVTFSFPTVSFSCYAKPHIMFSLQRLLGKENRFLDLLEACAKEAQKSAFVLVKFLENLGRATTLDDFIISRRAQKRIADQINVELSASFATSLEREDIETLSYRLYKIPKTVEKIVASLRTLLPPRSSRWRVIMEFQSPRHTTFLLPSWAPRGDSTRSNAVVERMVWAWILTIPVAGSIAYSTVRLLRALGWMP